MGASVYWDRGGPNSLVTTIRSRADGLHEVAQDIIRITAAEGAVLMAEFVEAATTKTGERRVETSGRSSDFGSVSPGRIDSGLLINQIASHNEVIDRTAIGSWGWFDPEDYFLEQEYGKDRIPAMHALFQSFVIIRERFFARVVAAQNGQRVFK